MQNINEELEWIELVWQTGMIDEVSLKGEAASFESYCFIVKIQNGGV
jgi:hypothetical protein